MRLLLQKDNNPDVIEIKEIETIGENTDILIFFINHMLRQVDIDEIEVELSNKIGKKCVVLNAMFDKKVVGIEK